MIVKCFCEQGLFGKVFDPVNYRYSQFGLEKLGNFSYTKKIVNEIIGF